MTPRFRLSRFLCLVLSLVLDCLAFEEGNPSNREKLWQEFMNQGKQHREQRRLADAEKNYLAAVSAAEQFGSEDSRVAASLNALATTYHEQGRYAEAESAYRRALSVWEAAAGPESESVAICLNNWAYFVRTAGSLLRLSRC
jgi:tetratricopeptide (TPR) repeat protein